MRIPVPVLLLLGLVAGIPAICQEPTPAPVQKTELEKKQQAEQERKKAAAETEYNRRYASEGTLYNLKPLTAFIPNGVTTIPPGSELEVIGKKPNGLLKLRCGELESEAALSLLTNDRDLAAQAASTDARNQLLLKQKRMKQAEEFRRRQLQQHREPTATPNPPPPAPKAPNPLGTPKLDSAR